jgi:hypothetical protein
VRGGQGSARRIARGVGRRVPPRLG